MPESEFADAERALCRISDVRAARIVAGPSGRPAEVRVLASPGKHTSQVVREVQAAALRSAGLMIDPRIIRVVQLDDVDSPNLPSSRPVPVVAPDPGGSPVPAPIAVTRPLPPAAPTPAPAHRNGDDAAAPPGTAQAPTPTTPVTERRHAPRGPQDRPVVPLFDDAAPVADDEPTEVVVTAAGPDPASGDTTRGPATDAAPTAPASDPAGDGAPVPPDAPADGGTDGGTDQVARVTVGAEAPAGPDAPARPVPTAGPGADTTSEPDTTTGAADGPDAAAKAGPDAAIEPEAHAEAEAEDEAEAGTGAGDTAGRRFPGAVPTPDPGVRTTVDNTVVIDLTADQLERTAPTRAAGTGHDDAEPGPLVTVGRLGVVTLDCVVALRQGSSATVEVSLRRDGKVYTGRGEGSAAANLTLRHAAEAALDALRQMAPAASELAVEGAGVTDLGPRAVALVSLVRVTPSHEEVLVGSTGVRGGDAHEAVVRAVLDATNRRLAVGR